MKVTVISDGYVILSLSSFLATISSYSVAILLRTRRYTDEVMRLWTTPIHRRIYTGRTIARITVIFVFLGTPILPSSLIKIVVAVLPAYQLLDS